ncbi:hypothetical protein [Alkalitalea saponilacus]|uniref:Outer membrane protein beta-barrel domain-containing protein n=1 Tax=Alkalitalea saponilacus TaxID=889453 RepID=A0A1T5HSP2_9BACT|nr:hypothetical protein [Alkalitalea saponilacus]ASB47706.1 hypothetical protein CDL62_00315 [Alkalitalea saponilacus]SKC23632.1 hypothetical protein SAMN03080601_02911 [Alkalitalea saponilacus]
MLKKYLKLTLLTAPLFLGCATHRETAATDHQQLIFRLQAGINKGGIVENTELDLVPGSPVDGFSGATNRGFNIGARILKPIGYNAVETGLDFMVNSQEFSYRDGNNQFFGNREVSLVQFMVPVLWNFGIVRKHHEQGLFQIKIGPVVQYNLLHFTHQGQLPEYSYNSVSAGISLGASSTPFRFQNGSSLGWFIEGYRGSQIYEDYYNQKSFDMPGSSYAKFGVIFQFNPF